MKNLILLLIITCSIASFGQQPKKTWKIIVKNTLKADENFTLVGRTLIENDYFIDSKDKEFLTIKSGAREVGNVSGRYFLTIAVRDSMIYVTGQTNADISITMYGVKSESEFEKISNKGARVSCMNIAFNHMNDFALKLGTNVEYVSE